MALQRWEGEFKGVTAVWLRWARPDGALLPTGSELAEQGWQRAEDERQRADDERQRARELEALLARYRERFGEIED